MSAPALAKREKSFGPFKWKWGKIAWKIAGAVLLFATYWKSLCWLAGRWRYDPYYSHGALVFIVSLCLVWHLRRKLVSVAPRGNAAGIALIVLAAFLHLLGIRGDFLLISAFSLLLLIAGLILTSWGWERLKLLSFPLAFVLFALPLPYVLIQKVSLKLQLITSGLVTVIWSFLGLPIRRYGVHLEFASFSLTVADACSGLRSIICIIALGTLIAYLASGRFLRRISFPVAGVSIALGANLLRIISTALIGELFGGETATAFFEHFSGFLFFGMAFFLMIALAKALGCSFDFTKKRNLLGLKSQPIRKEGREGWKESMVGWMGWMRARAHGWKIGRMEAKEGSKYRERNAREEKMYLHMATFVLLVITLTATFVVHGPTSQGELPVLSIFQTGLPGWQVREIKQEITWPGEKVVWQDLIKSGFPTVNMFVRYATNERARHSPETCSVAGGWIPLETKRHKIQLSNERSFPANLMTLIRGQERMVTLYWFVRDNRVIAGSIEYYMATVWRLWLTGSSKGTYVQLSAQCTEASQEAATKKLLELAPMIQRKVLLAFNKWGETDDAL